jgi:hypothetical protein
LANGRSTPARPAGADNYLRWRRTIDEHLELGRLRFEEYGMFSWLCTKADPRTGTLRTRWTVLAEQTGLSRNYVCKLCGTLRKKGYIAFPDHRGRRGTLVELAIDKFPLADGSYTELRRAAGRSQAHLPSQVPAQLLAELPAPVLASVEAQNAQKSTTSLGGRSRSRKRSRSSLRVRSADAATDPTSTDPSNPEARLDRAEALVAAPRALRETVELYWLKTGRDDLTPDDLSALRELDQAHTPAVIQKAITESVARFTRRGEDPRGVTVRYVWDSLRRFATRKAPAATPPPDRPAYPPGLTRLS